MRRDANTRSAFAADVVQRILDALCDAMPLPRRRPLCVGVSGLQGSGKSTLSRQLARLAHALGLRCEVLSLDDFYLGRRERLRLARSMHPLFVTRGVPGTHDVDLLLQTLDGLARASARWPVRVPRFDKGRDTRVPPSRWRSVTCAPSMVLLEGWCVGVEEQSATALARALNALERDEDPLGIWRRHANAALARSYARAWERLDRLVLLQAPHFDVVARWRGEQERALRRRGAPRAMHAASLQRFLAHYERLSRHALRTLPARSDLRLVLDESRKVRTLVVH
jgi:D-glycerate 3-kinase